MKFILKGQNVGLTTKNIFKDIPEPYQFGDDSKPIVFRKHGLSKLFRGKSSKPTAREKQI